MTESQKRKCHGIIHTASASAAAVGAGLAQLPGSDNAALIPIQITMTIALGSVFGIELTRSTAQAAVATAAATTVGRGISQVLVGWIPGVGNVINAATAASVTEGIGWVLARQFAKGKVPR